MFELPNSCREISDFLALKVPIRHTQLLKRQNPLCAPKSRNDALKLSDVIEVIQTDPDFRESTEQNKMFNGGGEITVTQPPPASQSSQQAKRRAYIKILEQPASKALRFRYECEGRSAGSIPGASSTSENKTFPTIQVVGYQGRAVVVVSCVTKDPPYRPHPHNLVGREGCKRGVCTLEIPTDTMTVHFSNLGIQCVKKKDIENALKIREEIRVDPYRTGFTHRNQPTSIDLNAVRLCFQVFLEGNTPGKFSVPLAPVVSEPIYDKKAMSDLSIVKLSHCVCTVDGGREDIILLCEKVAKEDIQVRFFEENSNWEAFADFQPTQVHKQHAIWFRPPRYKTLDIQEPVKVYIQLRRPSDGASSDALPFEMLPLDSDPGVNSKRKRHKIENPGQILRHLQEHDTTGRLQAGFPMDPIKVEPRDSTSPYLGAYGGVSPAYSNIGSSPQYISIQPTPPPDLMYQYQPNIGSSPHYPGNSPQYPGAVSPQAQAQTWNTPMVLNDLSSASALTASTQWNIPSAAAVNMNTTSNINEPIILYDFDKQANSEELNNILKDNVPLPEISGENLFPSISDIVVASTQDVNMTDSLTRFANITLEKM